MDISTKTAVRALHNELKYYTYESLSCFLFDDSHIDQDGPPTCQECWAAQLWRVFYYKDN